MTKCEFRIHRLQISIPENLKREFLEMHEIVFLLAELLRCMVASLARAATARFITATKMNPSLDCGELYHRIAI